MFQNSAEVSWIIFWVSAETETETFAKIVSETETWKKSFQKKYLYQEILFPNSAAVTWFFFSFGQNRNQSLSFGRSLLKAIAAQWIEYSDESRLSGHLLKETYEKQPDGLKKLGGHQENAPKYMDDFDKYFDSLAWTL